MVTRETQIFEFGSFRLIPSERQLFLDEKPIQLAPKAFDLLCVLVENSGHLVTKEELLQRVWPDSFVEEANLSVKMSALRRLLDQGSNGQQFIETVPRKGYRFVTPASIVSSDVSSITIPETPKTSDPVDEDKLPMATPRQNPVWIYLSAGLIVIAAILGYVILGNWQRGSQVAAPPNIGSIAVLPLESINPDPGQQYISFGLTDSLNFWLGKIDSLRVSPRELTSKYKDSVLTDSQIGRELGVDVVLGGSVNYLDSKVMVEAMLSDSASEKTFWRKSYEQPRTELQALQQELVQDVLKAIRAELPPAQISKFAPARARSPAAYDHYLRGRFYSRRQTREDNDIAIGSLEKATELDKDFAAAFAELAQAYVWKLFLFDPKNEKQWSEKAFVASEKALELDPNLAIAHLARGRLLWTPANHFPHDKAIAEYRRALSIDPNLDEARNQLALVYCHIGALDEALQESRKAMELNPANNLAQFRFGETLNFQGKYDEGLKVLNSIPAHTNPPLVGAQIAWALVNTGRTDEASALLEKLMKENSQQGGGLFISIQAVIDAKVGRRADAYRKIQSALEIGRGYGHFHHTAYYIACAFSLMNEDDEAIKWLEAAASDGFPCYSLFEIDRNLDNLRDNQRFQTFMADQRKVWEHHKSIL